MLLWSYGSQKGSWLLEAFISSTWIQVNFLALARIMSSDVEKAWDHDHANFILIALIVHGGPDALQLIANTIQGKAARCAHSKRGCRVLVALLREDRRGVYMDHVIMELLADARSLITHAYGHLVIKEMLEYARDQRVVRRITFYLMERLKDLAEHEHAAQVIEKVLEKAAALYPIGKYVIESGLAALAVELSSHVTGHHVIRHLLLYGADFTMEDLKQSEEDEGEARSDYVDWSRIEAVCRQAGLETLPTHETLPSDIAIQLLTTREAVSSLRAAAGKGRKYRQEIVEILEKMGKIAPQQQQQQQQQQQAGSSQSALQQQQAASSQSAPQQQHYHQRRLQAGSPQGLPLRPPPALDSDVNADLVDVDIDIETAAPRPPARQQFVPASGVDTRPCQ